MSEEEKQDTEDLESPDKEEASEIAGDDNTDDEVNISFIDKTTLAPRIKNVNCLSSDSFKNGSHFPDCQIKLDVKIALCISRLHNHMLKFIWFLLAQ